MSLFLMDVKVKTRKDGGAGPETMRLSETQETAILALYTQEGYNTEELAGTMHLSTRTVKNVLSKHGISAQRDKADRRECMIREYLDTGVTPKELAEKYGYALNYVHTILRDVSIARDHGVTYDQHMDIQNQVREMYAEAAKTRRRA